MKRKVITAKEAENGKWYEDYRGKPVLSLKKTDPATGRYMYAIYENPLNKIYDAGALLYEKC